jgi:hypothetical protein
VMAVFRSDTARGRRWRARGFIQPLGWRRMG